MPQRALTRCKIFRVARALAELIDAVLPTTCICCGTLGSHICRSCRASFEPSSFIVNRGGLSGVAVFELDEPIRQLIAAIKDSGRTAALGEVAEPMAEAIRAQLLADQSRTSPIPRLVAMPTSKRSRRKRGFDLNRMLARRVSRLTGLALDTGLVLTRQPDDQRRLGQQDRQANLSHSMAYRSRDTPGRFILVDDVVTTGSTLLEATRAIRDSGGEVLSFCVFAETRLLQDAKTEK